jgi:hypothetical protein
MQRAARPVGKEGAMAILRRMRVAWFVVWYLGGMAFVFYLKTTFVTATGMPAPWGFAFGFAVLFTMTFGVGHLVRVARRRGEPRPTR